MELSRPVLFPARQPSPSPGDVESAPCVTRQGLYVSDAPGTDRSGGGKQADASQSAH